MVLNPCERANHISETNNLVEYVSDVTCDTGIEHTELVEVDIWTKIMTKDVHNTKNYEQNQEMTTFFINRM